MKKIKRKLSVVNYDSIKFLMNQLTKKNKIIYLTTNSGYGIGEEKQIL